MGAGFNDRLAIDGRLWYMQPFFDQSGARAQALVGAWTSVINAALTYYGYQQSSPANGNACTLPFYGSRVALIAGKNTNCGMVDLYVDDVLYAGGIDLYASAVLKDVVVSAIEGLQFGPHVLKIVVNGKNASSSGYQTVLTAILTDVGPSNQGQYVDVYVRVMPVTTVAPQTGQYNTGFWNAAAVAAGGTSTIVNTNGSRLRVLVNSSAATEITVQHSVDNANWYDGETISFTAAGTKTLVVDCCSCVRLKSSQAATITAGYIYLRG